MGEAAGPRWGAAAERRFRFELAAHPGSPAQARRLTRARLNGWSVCEDTCDTAALVVSELVTNAIVHTASEHIVCELRDGADLVRIAVRDEGCAPDEPHPLSARPDDEHGRGLLLVDALCHAWGADEQGPGLVVWAELPRRAGGGPEVAGVLEAGVSETGSPEARGARADSPEARGPEAGLPEAGSLAAGSPEAGSPKAPRVDTRPSGDLGWGSRPKPGPSGGSGDDDEAQAQARRQDGRGTGSAWL